MSMTHVPFRSALGNIWGDLEVEMSRAYGDGCRSGSANVSGIFRPSMNLAETEVGFEVTLDLPGVSLQDISIEVTGDELLVCGHRVAQPALKDGKWHRVESSYGRFFRRIRVAHGLLADNIDAKYKDGVLTITVPKAENVKSRRIDIRA